MNETVVRLIIRVMGSSNFTVAQYFFFFAVPYQCNGLVLVS